VRGVGVTEQRQADQGVEVQIPRVVGWSAGALGIEQRRRVDVGVTSSTFRMSGWSSTSCRRR
jgi:hypothetical protein